MTRKRKNPCLHSYECRVEPIRRSKYARMTWTCVRCGLGLVFPRVRFDQPRASAQAGCEVVFTVGGMVEDFPTVDA